jgi:hypothetical protein
VHDFALLYLGVHLFDNCDLEAVEAAAARNWWELIAAPLPIRGGIDRRSIRSRLFSEQHFIVRAAHKTSVSVTSMRRGAC